MSYVYGNNSFKSCLLASRQCPGHSGGGWRLWNATLLATPSESYVVLDISPLWGQHASLSEKTVFTVFINSLPASQEVHLFPHSRQIHSSFCAGVLESLPN